MTFRHVLLATDFSEGADRATEIAVDLAKTCGAKLTLLHACCPPVLPYAEGVAFPVAQVEAAAEEALAAAFERVRQRWPSTEPVLCTGAAWQQIISAVEERGADVVVIGTHGKRGPSRTLLGSVADKVLRLSPVPVIAVPLSRQATG